MAICLFGTKPHLFLSDHDVVGASVCHDKADYGLVMCVTAAAEAA